MHRLLSPWTAGAAALALAIILACTLFNLHPKIEPAAAKPSAIPKKLTLSPSPVEPEPTKPLESEDRPFWESAIVPDPARPRLPTSVVIPSRPVSSNDTTAVANAVHNLSHAPRTADSIHQLNKQATLWFFEAPGDALEWLNTTDRFEDMSDTVAAIAVNSATTGDFDSAMASLDSIADPAIRRNTLLEIYRVESRTGRLTRDSLLSAGLAPREADAVLQGD